VEKKKIDYELWIHRIPADLVPPLAPEREHLLETYRVWKHVVDAKVCWRVESIDQWNHLWIDVRFKNDAGELEHHSLAIDDDCHEKFESREYEVEFETP
jgi:hypothetical protein